MIRLRNKEGDVVPVSEDATFVEICSQDGKIGCVFFEGDDCSINVFDKEASEAKIYENRFNVSFVDKIIDLGNRYKDV
jgi:hypothetical protein